MLHEASRPNPDLSQQILEQMNEVEIGTYALASLIGMAGLRNVIQTMPEVRFGLGSWLLDRVELSGDEQTQKARVSMAEHLERTGIIVLTNHHDRFDAFVHGIGVARAVAIEGAVVPVAGYLYWNENVYGDVFEPIDRLDGATLVPVLRAKEQRYIAEGRLVVADGERLDRGTESVRLIMQTLKQPGSVVFMAATAERTEKCENQAILEIANLILKTNTPVYLAAATRSGVGPTRWRWTERLRGGYLFGNLANIHAEDGDEESGELTRKQKAKWVSEQIGGLLSGMEEC